MSEKQTKMIRQAFHKKNLTVKTHQYKRHSETGQIIADPSRQAYQMAKKNWKNDTEEMKSRGFGKERRRYGKKKSRGV